VRAPHAHHWPGINPANGSRASSSAVRALCAHHWLATGPPLARAAHKGFYPGETTGKRLRPPAKKFFQLFSQTPLRDLRQCDTLAAVQRPD